MTRLLASLWPYRLVRWTLGGVFLWASRGKLTDPQAVAGTISDFGLVPEDILFATALGLMALELVAGLGLLCDVRGAVGLTACLLLVFVGALSYGLAIGLDIECGCFGPGYRSVGLQEALWRDVVLLAACGYLWWFRWLTSARPLSVCELWRKVFSEQGSTEKCAP